MKNDRKDGILLVNTQKTYKVSENGDYVEKTRVICKDIDYKAEWVAADLQQLFFTAMFSFAGNNKDKTSNESNVDVEDINEYNSPTIKQIEDIANGYKMMMMANNVVKISEFMNIFEDIVKAGLIQTDAEKPIGISDWEKFIHRDDKMKIAFCYIAFFVNPSLNAAEKPEKENVNEVSEK